jgi:copper(I)-binding protein
MKHLCLSVFICGSACLGATAEVTVKDAWVRGTVPAQSVTGAFMTLTSTTDAKLVGVKTPIAMEAQIHESTMKGDVSHMHAVESVALPAGKPVQLKPGGYHVMLMGLAKAVAKGQKVPITLEIVEADGKRSKVEVQADVRPLGK